MTADFITKRPHKKSRGGCQTCKTKRVKCDEGQPQCGFCEKRKFTCLYIKKVIKQSSDAAGSPSSDTVYAPSSPSNSDEWNDTADLWDMVAAPTPAITTSSGMLSPADLRMMHHWSTSTWSSIAIGPESSSVLLLRVPQLAFENDYLLNCILGISSLHIEHLNPQKIYNQKQTSKYRSKALLGFRQAIASAEKQPINWEAGLIMSILLLALCSKDNIDGTNGFTIVNWVVLYRGLAAIIMMKSYDAIQTTGVKPIFRRELRELRFAPVVPRNLVKLLEGISPSDSDFEYLEPYCNVLDALGILYGSLSQDGVAPELWVRVISWPSYTSQEFTNCAVEQRPRALIILAHYLCFIKLIQGLWWVDDMPDAEIRAIMKLIGDQWLPFMAIPLAVVEETNKEKIGRMLLLGEIPLAMNILELQDTDGAAMFSTDISVLDEANCSSEVLYPILD
ncbi:Zn2/Cys6 DNA-binding protein [Glarea lozoyensis ATCC 20868]|uniref:Zn2/Cys6 DNA-binding protein n=1 Tax=Glarea lozoyensis (strain ATCC 20868 / MF5171) TaxID=1116229 RepID=S3CPR1_GLAL2|nr:Zn2/Cys6 DNA-binding protein [Glarea lozoyensis ATCC 20868]EPE27129.1 Zn2/Cys6 DNA-binding protein [Glarea lozoyensis ATCC 20868]